MSRWESLVCAFQVNKHLILKWIKLALHESISKLTTDDEVIGIMKNGEAI